MSLRSVDRHLGPASATRRARDSGAPPNPTWYARRVIRGIALLALSLVAGCGESSADESSSDAGSDASACEDFTAGGHCGEPGRVCDHGSLSCWKKATCQPNGVWEITCGIWFPDGGPCC